MLLVPIENSIALICLLVLSGSLIGSAKLFIFPKEVPRVPRASWKYGDDWRGPTNHKVPIYTTSQPIRSQGPRRFLWLIVVIGLSFAAGTAALFAKQTPWTLTTDLRHLAAGAHCGVAQKLGLAPAQLGDPGYHKRLDPDRNGVACEAVTVASNLAVPTVVTQSLSNAQLSWPQLTAE